MTPKKDESFAIPAEIVLSARSFRKLVKMIEKPGKPTKALLRLRDIQINAPPVCRKCYRCHRGACHKAQDSSRRSK